MPKNSKRFEDALNRLDEIIGLIEIPETPLEEAVALYKEGVGLTLFCSEKLNKYNSEISALNKSMTGFAEATFEGGGNDGLSD